MPITLVDQLSIYIHLYSPMNGRKNAKQYKNNAVTLTILKYSAVLTPEFRVPPATFEWFNHCRSVKFLILLCPRIACSGGIMFSPRRSGCLSRRPSRAAPGCPCRRVHSCANMDSFTGESIPEQKNGIVRRTGKSIISVRWTCSFLTLRHPNLFFFSHYITYRCCYWGIK